MFNTDHGSQFTSQEFTQVLQDRGVKISMDGKGRYADNIFVERLWRTVKYEEVYLKACASAGEAGNWEPTSGSTMTRGPIRPWDTGPQARCSARHGPPGGRVEDKEVFTGTSLGILKWRDSHLTPPQFCPTDWVHLRCKVEPLQFPYIYLYACKVLTLIYIYIFDGYPTRLMGALEGATGGPVACCALGLAPFNSAGLLSRPHYQLSCYVVPICTGMWGLR